MLGVGKWNVWQYYFLLTVGRGDTEFNIWLHRVCRVCTSNFGREEAQSDITSQPQYLAWPAWDPTTYGHVRDMFIVFPWDICFIFELADGVDMPIGFCLTCRL
jgi:hypothetical protein